MARRPRTGSPTGWSTPASRSACSPAQRLAQTRAGARGALLFYSCVPTTFFGGWPAGVPVQIHGMDADPIFVGEGDIDAAGELVASADEAELFLYPGDQHYFADSSPPSYDPEPQPC